MTPNAAQRQDASKIIMDDSKREVAHYKKSNPITTLIGWHAHDSIKNRHHAEENVGWWLKLAVQ